jgi:hypothetical protein
MHDEESSHNTCYEWTINAYSKLVHEYVKLEEKTYVDQGRDGETNTHKNRTKLSLFRSSTLPPPSRYSYNSGN